jgi:ATP-binding cassette subfamily B multidrug efflux pump
VEAGRVRVVKYLKRHMGAVLAIMALLVVQAFCELSLPAYTADIVDVGIQQGGVDEAVPQQMRAETFDELCMLLSADDEAALRASYDQAEDGTYVVNDHGRQDEALGTSLMAPLALLGQAESGGSDVAPLAQAYGQGTMTKDHVAEQMSSAYEHLQEAGEDVMRQQAALAVRTEYEACGIDVHALQMSYLLSVGLRMLGVTLVSALAAALISLIASRTGARIGRELRERLFRRVVEFSDAEIQGFSAASLITRGTNDIQQIQMVSILIMRMVLFAPVLAIGGIIMVVRTNVSMSWIIVLGVVVVACMVGVLITVAMPKFKMMQALVDRVNLVAREVLTGLPVVRAFNRQRYEEDRFDEANRNLRDTQLFTNRVMSFMQPGMMLTMNGISVLIVWVAAGYIDAGTIQTGDMIAFITYAMVIITSFLMMSMLAIMLPRAEVAAGRIDEVLATEPTIRDPEAPRDGELGSGGGALVRFEDVSFSYAGAEKPALSHVSFTADPGRTTALIGATGSGKTTVLRLIMRSYDVTQGRVMVDGIDVRDLTQRALHATFGYVPQKAFLFAGTVESNIAYGNENLQEDDVWQAARTAQAVPFIRAKDGGLQASVSQGGSDVSGGQRQRLAIARALAMRARAYLFDDSFSALDYATDAALRTALRSDLGGSTVIIVAQRISTIRHADNIIVLDEGTVAGQGTHDQLMETCAVYREIASSQLSAAELAGGDVA